MILNIINHRTTLKLGNENTNILASGGIRGEIRMFHPANKVPSLGVIKV